MNERPRIPLPINWPLLPLPDEQGRLNYPGLEKSVSQAIRIILSTRPGEQLMAPNFGGGLDEFVHMPNTAATRRDIQRLVSNSLAQWENRIDVLRVEVTEIPDRPTHLRVEILYRLRRSGTAQRMGLTIRLE